jgi:hypothetical protein
MTWLCEEFHECPTGADEATVTLYIRAWVWHMFATMLFPDSTGDMASWMYIPPSGLCQSMTTLPPALLLERPVVVRCWRG